MTFYNNRKPIQVLALAALFGVNLISSCQTGKAEDNVNSQSKTELNEPVDTTDYNRVVSTYISKEFEHVYPIEAVFVEEYNVNGDLLTRINQELIDGSSDNPFLGADKYVYNDRGRLIKKETIEKYKQNYFREEYTYDGDLLVSMEEWNDQEKTYVERYSYSKNGDLKKLERFNSFGKKTGESIYNTHKFQGTNGVVKKQTEFRESNSLNYDLKFIGQFDANDRLIFHERIRLLKDGTQDYEYKERREYDEQGRLVAVYYIPHGKNELMIQYMYKDDDNVPEKRERFGGDRLLERETKELKK